MKLYLTANKELLERTVREGFGAYWRDFKRGLAEFAPEDLEEFDNTHTLFELVWPPDDDESCLEFTFELTPQQIEMYYVPGPMPRSGEFVLPFELLIHAPFRLLSEAEIIAGIRAGMDEPDPQDGTTLRDFLRQKVARGEASRYERAALDEDEQRPRSA